MELDYSRRKYVVARRQLKRGREREKKKRNGDPQLMVIRTMRFNQLMIACDRVPERARARHNDELRPRRRRFFRICLAIPVAGRRFFTGVSLMYRFSGRQGERKGFAIADGYARLRNEIYVWRSVTVISRALTGYLFLAERCI